MKFNIVQLEILVLIFLCCFIKYCINDLPVHCLKSQIVGKWNIKATKLYEVKSGHEMKCGHLEPSTEATSYKAKPKLKFDKEFIKTKFNTLVLMYN
jgi:hypothetical protein